MKKKFQNPPINELVIGLYFSPPLIDLRAEHVGLYWSEIKEKFPHSKNAVPVGTEFLTGGPEEIFPLPRFWFISEDNGTLIQIQKNAFLFNWRKGKENYPHYETVKKEFDKNFQGYEEFLKRAVGIEKVYIERCELSYINHIPSSDLYQGVQDIPKIFPSISFPDTGIKSLEGVNLKTSYKATDNIELTVSVQNRFVGIERKKSQELCYYELRATGKIPELTKKEADKFFETSHNIIGDCFLTMVSDEAKKYWDRKGSS